MAQGEDKRFARLLRDLTNSRTGLVCVVAGVAGSVLFVVLRGNAWWERGLLALAAAILGTVFLLTFDLYTRRTFLREILATVALTEDVGETGLIGVGDSLKIVDFTAMSTAKRIDVCFISNITWISNHADQIRSCLSRRGTRVRVLIPNPDDSSLRDEILRRFGGDTTRDLITSEMNAILKRLHEVRDVCKYPSALSIHILKCVPAYAYYRIDKLTAIQVFATRLGRDKGRRPVLKVETTKPIGSFFSKDFELYFGESEGSGCECVACVSKAKVSPSVKAAIRDSPVA